VVDSSGLPIRLALTTGEAHDNRLAAKLLSRLKSGSMLLADRGYDADWIRDLVRQHGAWANIPPKRNRTEALCFSPYLYRARNLVERFFNKIKHCRRVATRYDKLATLGAASARPFSTVSVHRAITRLIENRGPHRSVSGFTCTTIRQAKKCLIFFLAPAIAQAHI
jgi:transposase